MSDGAKKYSGWCVFVVARDELAGARCVRAFCWVLEISRCEFILNLFDVPDEGLLLERGKQFSPVNPRLIRIAVVKNDILSKEDGKGFLRFRREVFASNRSPFCELRGKGCSSKETWEVGPPHNKSLLMNFHKKLMGLFLLKFNLSHFLC